jgi:hypothetical protein
MFVFLVSEKIWPLVANVTSNITIYEGEDALFYCYVTNDKNARIQWLRIEAAEITGVRPQHTVSKRFQTTFYTGTCFPHSILVKLL